MNAENRMSTRYITIAGYVVCASAVLLAIYSEDRTWVFPTFLFGFVLVVCGIFAGMMRSAEVVESKWMRLGMRVGVIGMIVMVLSALAGLVLSTNHEIVVFNVGFALVTIGVIVGIIGLVKKV